MNSVLPLITESTLNRYYEPFLGGGAVFFALAPKVAFLSDLNSDLINTYTQVKLNHEVITARLKQMDVSIETFQRVRSVVPTTPIERAVRFLYLNRTAFGGIYRLNRKGEFNVPYGGGERTPEPLWNEDLLQNASRSLNRVNLESGDFEDRLATAGAGDLVYCDPTYTISHNNNGFVRYNERNFSWEDQRRLASVCERLRRAGATVIVSNADHTDILDLYKTATIHRVDRMSLLSPNAAKRRATTELLFVLKPKV